MESMLFKSNNVPENSNLGKEYQSGSYDNSGGWSSLEEKSEPAESMVDHGYNDWDNLNDSIIKEKLKEIEGMKVPLPKKVYYIESPQDNSVLVGINVSAEYRDDGTAVIEWFDTVKNRSMIASSTAKNGDLFAFSVNGPDGNSSYYYLSPLDLKHYNENVKDKMAIPNEFNSEDEMIEAFLESGGH